MPRNIRLHNQTKRGAGGWVVFFTVPDVPYQKGFERDGHTSYSGRVGMDFDKAERGKAVKAKALLIAIPDNEWNYCNAWNVYSLVS